MHNILRVILLVLLALGVFSSVQANNLADGLKAYRASEYTKARKIFEQLAKQDEVMAQRYIAEMYDKGHGGKKDYSQAIYWYRKAAANKDSKSQFHLGLKYANGHGVLLDNKQAYAWFALAFNNGYKPAAEPIKVLNKTMSVADRQAALIMAEQMLHTLQ